VKRQIVHTGTLPESTEPDSFRRSDPNAAILKHMGKPLIAVSTRPRGAGDVSGWDTTTAAVMQMLYVEAIWRAGCNESMLAPRHIDHDDALDLLKRVDGLVLVGGGDVDPARYGQDRHPEVYGVSEESDSLELTLARAAVELGVPTLAICRGMQVLNIALGGTLKQHLDPSEGWDPHRLGECHSVQVVAGSRVAKIGPQVDAAWSYHHQAIDALGDGLVVTAKADDGCIEAIEFSSTDDWIVGVQWHPERTAETDPQQQWLFDTLAIHAQQRVSAKMG
jgi:putative glutamine amidotransferase